jgi:hypothetical protein
LLLEERERMSRQITDLESLVRKMAVDVADQTQRHTTEMGSQQTVFQKKLGEMGDQMGTLQKRTEELVSQLRKQE